MFNNPGKKLGTWAKVVTVAGVISCIGMAIYKVYNTLVNGVLLSYDALIADCLMYLAVAAFIALIGLFSMAVSSICERLNYLCSVYARTAKQVEEHEKQRLEKEKERLKKEQERKAVKSKPAKHVEVVEPERPIKATPKRPAFSFPEVEDLPDDDNDDFYYEDDHEDEAVADDEDEYETLRQPVRKAPSRKPPVVVEQEEEDWDEDDDDEEDEEIYEAPVRKAQPKRKAVRQSEPEPKPRKTREIKVTDDEPEVFKKKKKRLSDFFFEEEEAD